MSVKARYGSAVASRTGHMQWRSSAVGGIRGFGGPGARVSAAGVRLARRRTAMLGAVAQDRKRLQKGCRKTTWSVATPPSIAPPPECGRSWSRARTTPRGTAISGVRPAVTFPLRAVRDQRRLGADSDENRRQNVLGDGSTPRPPSGTQAPASGASTDTRAGVFPASCGRGGRSVTNTATVVRC
jgi:hypothetical protein